MYCPDSVFSQIELPNLYFSPDSHFQENTSNFMDYDGFSLTDWSKIGQPSIKNILDMQHVKIKGLEEMIRVIKKYNKSLC